MAAQGDPRRRQLFGVAGSLFDSDVYESYTAAYAWASNQAAHTGLGFLAAAAVAALFPWTRSHGWILFIPYFGKEAVDLYTASRTYTGAFRIPMIELALDSLADASFFSVGVAFLFLSEMGWQGLVWTLVLLAGVSLPAAWYFYPKKRAFDKAGLPYLFRLGRYDATITTAQRDGLNAFIAATDKRGILIWGPSSSGKTTLADAIASECTDREQYVLYLPAPRAVEMIADGKSGASALGEPWTIAEADVVVIDDCVDLNLPAGVTTALKGKRLVWVLSALADRAATTATIEAACGPVWSIDAGALHYKPRP